jgi:hypothetical protein
VWRKAISDPKKGRRRALAAPVSASARRTSQAEESFIYSFVCLVFVFVFCQPLLFPSSISTLID